MTKVRLQRLNQIVDCVVRAGGAGATRRQILECLNLKLTPHFRSLIDQCLHEGYLTAVLDDNVHPAIWRYFATDKAIV